MHRRYPKYGSPSQIQSQKLVPIQDRLSLCSPIQHNLGHWGQPPRRSGFDYFCNPEKSPTWRDARVYFGREDPRRVRRRRQTGRGQAGRRPDRTACISLIGLGVRKHTCLSIYEIFMQETCFSEPFCFLASPLKKCNGLRYGLRPDFMDHKNRRRSIIMK